MRFWYVFLLILLSSCHDNVNVDIRNTNYKISSDDPPLRIIILDSCEYFYINTTTTKLLTHKGNCTNCLKRK